MAGPLTSRLSLPCVGFALAASAAAQEATPHSADPAEGAPAGSSIPAEQGSVAGRDREFARPYGAVEFGIGILALPDARVCGEAGCDRGDLSLEVDAWPLFRASPSFAVGAGLTLALTPAQDVPQGDQLFPREHSRRYFQAEGIGRYYLLHGQRLEAWTGLSAGLVVVSDNFRTKGGSEDVTLIGSDSANIATEGLSLGLAAGVTFGVSETLQVGGTLRVANWFLPSRHERISFGEEASLADRVTMINAALVVAYHAR
ncbi:MAG TPA: hypothetical protein VFS67_11620 [Polyangiaceae bacterium]|jgi:hypothetical protein|nr:hypothetical protein [Polyangiaceae bacterium]